MIIIKGFAILLLLSGHAGLVSANYGEAMRHYEQQEYRQAMQAFDTAAHRGDADAQYMLGRLHETGSGTPQNFVLAHQWYNLAAAEGNRHAATARDSLTERMTSKQLAEAQQAARAWKPEDEPVSQVTSRPRPDIETLSDREGVAEIQRELNRLGYSVGPADGLMGNRTRSAIREYQGNRGMARNGNASAELLKRLRQTNQEAMAQDAPPEATESSNTGSRRVALQDDFSDGDFRRNPPWTVLSGDFEVDDNGLRSIVATQRAGERESRKLSAERPEEIGLAMLALIQNQMGNAQGGEALTKAEPARIFVNAPVDNAFRVEMKVASRQRPGRLEMGLFQGNRPDGTGYRLVYSAGARPGLSLVRLRSASVEEVARHEGRLDLEDGRFHDIVWTRDENGVMQIHVNNQRLIRVQDTGLRDGFQGFVLVNQGGDFTLGRVRVEEQESLAEQSPLLIGADMQTSRYVF